MKTVVLTAVYINYKFNSLQSSVCYRVLFIYLFICLLFNSIMCRKLQGFVLLWKAFLYSIVFHMWKYPWRYVCCPVCLSYCGYIVQKSYSSAIFGNIGNLRKSRKWPKRVRMPFRTIVVKSQGIFGISSTYTCKIIDVALISAWMSIQNNLF